MSQTATELRVVESHYITEHGHQTDAKIANADGDTDDLPDRVTGDVARRVWDEFHLDVEDYGIAVGPPESDDE